MLLTRIVDDCAWRLHEQGYIDFVASCRGHEAAQVGSAVCIEVGKDFTLPYYRDLGVVLTIGMTPYEVFRTYLQMHIPQTATDADQELHPARRGEPVLHWGYHKRNTVTGPAPVATQILHAAGIAFASKLRKAPIVTIAYCGDGATSEPDFLEGIRFASLQQLPVLFICEQNCQTDADIPSSSSCLKDLPLPEGLTHQRIDGNDVMAVYMATRSAMEHAREGRGPVLLEMYVTRSRAGSQAYYLSSTLGRNDPLSRCQQFLQEQDMWDDEWAKKLYTRISAEVEQAMQDAMRDTQPPFSRRGDRAQP
ncbi:thiamine pyrophosphate-dependent dehydrogenase E1 component subunit alpha [Ktedonosporobacter rubrisoli]|nr:thiamine pyrophosphate-dependent dehydrogenase E1 component subunit alpha [Ktedonosporobacter rubrisoli]